MDRASRNWFEQISPPYPGVVALLRRGFFFVLAALSHRHILIGVVKHAKAEFSLVGMKQVSDKLRALRQDVRPKIAQGAMKKAAALLKAYAQEGALRVDDPETGRMIRDNVKYQFAARIYRKSGDIVYRVGVNTKRGRIPNGNPDEGPRGNTPHWHLVEYGTELTRAQPYMRPALENNINELIDVIAAETERAIDSTVS